MQLFKLEKEIENAGEAQETMRLVIREIEKGHKKGDGWVIGEGEIERKPEIRAKILNPELHQLAFRLKEIIDNNDLMEDLYPREVTKVIRLISESLSAEGYGVGNRVDSSETKLSEEIKTEPGDTTTPTETTSENASQPLEGTEEKVEEEKKGFRLPWEKK